MIIEGIVAIIYAVAEAILSIFPTVDMEGNNAFLAQNVYPAYKTFLEMPLIGTLFEIVAWYVVFEITLFLFRAIVALLRSIRVLGADPIPQ